MVFDTLVKVDLKQAVNRYREVGPGMPVAQINPLWFLVRIATRCVHSLDDAQARKQKADSRAVDLPRGYYIAPTLV